MRDEKCATFCIYRKRGKKQLLSPHSTTQRVSLPLEYIFVLYNSFGAESFALLCYPNKWHKYNVVFFFIIYNTLSFTQQEENWLSTFETRVSRKTNGFQWQEVKWEAQNYIMKGFMAGIAYQILYRRPNQRGWDKWDTLYVLEKGEYVQSFGEGPWLKTPLVWLRHK